MLAGALTPEQETEFAFFICEAGYAPLDPFFPADARRAYCAEYLRGYVILPPGDEGRIRGSRDLMRVYTSLNFDPVLPVRLTTERQDCWVRWLDASLRLALVAPLDAAP